MNTNADGMATNFEADGWEDILEVIAIRTSTEEAQGFHRNLGLELFAGGMLRLLPYRGSFSLEANEISCRFQPLGFPDITEFEPIHELIEESLNPELRAELDDFISTRSNSASRADVGLSPLGSNSLRTTLRLAAEEPEDFVGWVGDSKIPAFSVEFGPTDWWRIQAYCNRLHDDPDFRLRALENGWVREAVPFNVSGKVPSFVAVHVVVSAGPPDDPFLVLTQRRSNLRYYPDLWEVGVAENHHGPRLITKGKRAIWVPGDRDFHQCARRGLAEELGLGNDDVESLVLLGLFVEAAFGSIVAVFHAHVPLSWKDLRRRVARLAEMGNPLEANLIAREPLNTQNLVRLLFAPIYEPPNLDRGTVIVAGKLSGPAGFHPSVPARLLQYLAANRERYPKQEVAAVVESALDQLAFEPKPAS